MVLAGCLVVLYYRKSLFVFQAMATKMESLYGDLAEYFVFDVQKYTLEEFMSDIKTFKNQFKVKFNTIGQIFY